jgi:peptide chain release factor 1
MLERLASLEETFAELSRQIGAPEVLADPSRYQKVARAYKELEGVVEKYRQYRSLETSLENTRKMLEEELDPDLLALAREELKSLESQRSECEQELRVLLLPKDPNDAKNIILEIRAGTGGDEATLFAQEIFRMYSRYAERNDWKVEVLSVNESTVGGVKEIIGIISGNGVYSRLKFESGVQRVQRVPETETQGRVHTSAVTVAVLPEADEVEVKIDPNELRVDTFCSSGPGGQSVNTTYSAVRITHIPTGEVVTCQDEKSQIKNKARALKVLRSRLYERAQREQQEEIAAHRRSMVGRGDRSEKIRTYNFPQNRMTDHRIGLTMHQLESILGGELDPVIDALITSAQTQALKEEPAA